MQYTCLIIAGPESAGAAMQAQFHDYGFKTCVVTSMRHASGLLREWRFDAAVLDADDFGERYVDMVRSLRRASRVPLLMLTQSHDEATELSALDSGATDIVHKPASARLVTAKLRRLLEIGSQPPDEPPEVTLGPLTLNVRHATASVDHRPLVLTSHQFELLYLLARHPGQFVHREAIARALRSNAAAVGRSADVHIYRIRRKLRALGDTGLCLDTVHGRGYCLSLDGTTRLDDSAWSEAADDAVVN